MFTGPLISTGRSKFWFDGRLTFRSLDKDCAMKNEATREMVLQTMVALLAMGLAVLSLMLMGRWV
jgi:hypothetical protein